MNDEEINIKTGGLEDELARFFGGGLNERDTSDLMAKLDSLGGLRLAPLYEALQEDRGRYSFKSISTAEGIRELKNRMMGVG